MHDWSSYRKPVIRLKQGNCGDNWKVINDFLVLSSWYLCAMTSQTTPKSGQQGDNSGFINNQRVWATSSVCPWKTEDFFVASFEGKAEIWIIWSSLISVSSTGQTLQSWWISSPKPSVLKKDFRLQLISIFLLFISVFICFVRELKDPLLLNESR